MATIQLNNVTKNFGGVEVIHGANLSVEDGEFVVFVGPSGCGKSTLLRLLSGLEDLSSGEIAIDGARVDHLPPAQRGLAMVFQSYALYPHMTVYQNMSYALKVARKSKQEIDQRVRAAAEILQLTEYLDRKPKALSGGQRQRVAIGRAIVREPRVFLFDEPLSNLDAKLRVQMRIELTNLHKQLKSTMIYVTHDQVEAMTMADKIVVMRDGNIEQVGAPLDLFNRPNNKFVAGFIGSPSMNFFEGRVIANSDDAYQLQIGGGPAVTIKTSQALTVGDSVTLGIRPEDLQPVEGDKQATIVGAVSAVERLGSQTYAYVKTAQNDNVVVHYVGDLDIDVDQELKLGFDLSKCHFFDPDEQRIEMDV